MRSSSLFVLLSVALLGCPSSDQGAAKEECTLSNRKLADTQWAMDEAMPEGPNRTNPRARMKFYKEEGLLKVDYTVGSPYEVHTYDCIPGSEEVRCAEEPKLFDWCLSLEAWQEGACNAQKLKELAGDAEIKGKDIAKAQADVAAELKTAREKFKDNPRMMKQYLASKNFLGNKLQGLLSLKVRKEKCDLLVTDQYMTLFNGKRVVDSNPVGTNPFVKLEGEYLFENCMEGSRFLALEQSNRPTDEEIKSIDPNRAFSLGDTVNYHYIGMKHLEAKEGCSYSADVFVQWQPTAKDVNIETYDCKAQVPDENDPEKAKAITKCVDWRGSHAWSKDSVETLKFVADEEMVPRGFYGLTRYETCADGEKKELDTICASTRVMEM